MSVVLTIGDSVWRSIPRFEGYQADQYGNIRSLKRKYPQIMAKRLRWDNKYDVNLSVHGCLTRQLVHRLTCAAWFGWPNGESVIVLHKNNDATDNRIDNIRWGSLAENTQQMWDEKRRIITGHKNPNYKHGRDTGRNRRQYMKEWRAKQK